MVYRLMNPLLNAVFNHASPSNKHKELVQSLANYSTGYTILVPETSILEWSVDKDTSLPFRDLCLQDDFIASHIIQVPTGSKSHQRARYFGTVNGKTIVINEGNILTHRGFKLTVQTSIVGEYVFNPGTPGFPPSAQFVVYVIRDPLVGQPMPSKEISATISSRYEMAGLSPQTRNHKKRNSNRNNNSTSGNTDDDWKEDLNLERIMAGYPTLRRQIWNPLRLVLENFSHETAKSEDDIVNMLDNAVDVAIQIFQSGDGAAITEMTTEYGFTGEDVTDLLHEYIERNVYYKVWNKLLDIRREKDLETQEAIDRIRNIDLSQIGLPDVSSCAQLAQLDMLVAQAVSKFNTLPSCSGAEAKIATFLSVLRILGGKRDDGRPSTSGGEPHAAPQVSADYLVSLLLLVVCRSRVENVGTELYYVKTFTYRDVEYGQLGYALLTFEGVLYHIVNETENLQQVSQNNQDLWDVIQQKSKSVNEYLKSIESSAPESDRSSWQLILKSKNNSGESCLMQAVQTQNLEAVQTLLSYDIIDLDYLLSDRTVNGTTLLKAAMESEQPDLIHTIFDAIGPASDNQKREYFALKDNFQRTIGHYLFHAPQLIERIGHLINWTTRDHNGQTPLFGLCRCYDHPNYEKLVESAFKAWHESTAGARKNRLPILDHVDDKGNTLLHIVKTHDAMLKVLDYKPDINWPNFKGMTPMMIYSRYSRHDAIKTLSKHPLLDLDRHEVRGLTALEVAKDAQTMRILDEIYLLKRPKIKNRVTAIPRTLFLDKVLYFTIESLDIDTGKITVVRRTFDDFVFLQKWLTYENPYSWIPALKTPRDPFAVPLKPSRQVIHEVQTRLNALLRTLLSHPTFTSHELLWEFLLIQDFSKEQSKDRCRRKLESEKEMQYDDVTVYKSGDLDLVKTFFQHALRETSRISEALSKLTVAAIQLKSKAYDYAEAHKILANKLDQDSFLHEWYANSMVPYYEFAHAMQGKSLMTFGYNLGHIANTASSVVTALSQPLSLVNQLESQEGTIQKVQNSLEKLNSKSGWPMGMFEEKRERDVKDAQDRIYIGQNDIQKLSSDIKYAHITSASELGGFYIVQETELRHTIREYAEAMLRDSQERLMRLTNLRDSFRDYTVNRT